MKQTTRRPTLLWLTTLFAVLLFPTLACAAVDQPELVPFADASHRHGYLDAQTLRIKIPARYTQAGFFHDGLALVADDTQAGRPPVYLKGWIDKQGTYVIKPRFVAVYPVKGADGKPIAGLYEASLPDHRTGVLSLATRDWLIKPRKDANPHFFDRRNYQLDNSHWVADGALHATPEGSVIRTIDYENKLVHVVKQGQDKRVYFGVFGWDGTLLIPVRYRKITYYADLHRALGKRLEHSLVSRVLGSSPLIEKLTGKYALHTDLIADGGQVLHQFDGHHEVRRLYGHVGYEMGNDINRIGHKRLFDLVSGDMLDREASISAVETYIRKRAEANTNARIVRRDGAMGVVDASGRLIIPAIYSALFKAPGWNGPEQWHYYTAAKDKHWGMLAADGTVVVPFKYDGVDVIADYFRWGWVSVSNGTQKALVNIKSGVALPFINGGYMAHENVVVAYRHDAQGNHAWFQLWSPAGKPLTHKHFQRMEYHEHYLIARLDGKGGALSATGKALVPFKYDGLSAVDSTMLEASMYGVRVYVGLDGTAYFPAEGQTRGWYDPRTSSCVLRASGVSCRYL